MKTATAKLGPHARRMFGCFGLILLGLLVLVAISLSQHDSARARQESEQRRQAIAIAREALMKHRDIFKIGKPLSVEPEGPGYAIRFEAVYRRAEGGVEPGVVVCRIHGHDVSLTYE